MKNNFMGFLLMYFGVTCWLGSLFVFGFGEEAGFTMGVQIGLFLLVVILGTICLIKGLKLYNSKPKNEEPHGYRYAAGRTVRPDDTRNGPAYSSTTFIGPNFSGTIHTGTFRSSSVHTGTGANIHDPELAKELNELFDEMNGLFAKTFNQPGIVNLGRPVMFNTPPAPGGNGGSGRTAPSNEPVTVECPGCGAPVSVTPSKPGECEYCGNKVRYRHPEG